MPTYNLQYANHPKSGLMRRHGSETALEAGPATVETVQHHQLGDHIVFVGDAHGRYEQVCELIKICPAGSSFVFTGNVVSPNPCQMESNKKLLKLLRHLNDESEADESDDAGSNNDETVTTCGASTEKKNPSLTRSLSAVSKASTASSGEPFIGATTVRAENEDALLLDFEDELPESDRLWLKSRAQIVHIPSMSKSGLSVVRASTACTSVKTLNCRHSGMRHFPFLVVGHDNFMPGLTTDGKNVACLDGDIRAETGALAALVVPKGNFRARKIVTVKAIPSDTNSGPCEEIPGLPTTDNGKSVISHDANGEATQNNKSGSSSSSMQFHSVRDMKKQWMRQKTKDLMKYGMLLRQPTRKLEELSKTARVEDAFLAKAFGMGNSGDDMTPNASIEGSASRQTTPGVESLGQKTFDSASAFMWMPGNDSAAEGMDKFFNDWAPVTSSDPSERHVPVSHITAEGERVCDESEALNVNTEHITRPVGPWERGLASQRKEEEDLDDTTNYPYEWAADYEAPIVCCGFAI